MTFLSALSRAANSQAQRRQSDLDRAEEKQRALLAESSVSKQDPGKNYWKPAWEARKGLEAAQAVRAAVEDVVREAKP